jgi:hypothetical protein
MIASINYAYQVNPDVTFQKGTAKTKEKTPESITLGNSSGVGATCCAVVSLDEAASSAINPDRQASENGEYHSDGLTHIPTRSEIPLTAVAGYLSAGGIIISDQIARDNAAKQKGLEDARLRITKYTPDQSTDKGKAQFHAKAAFSEVLTARVKRAGFERLVNGRLSEFNSAAILAGQFVPLAQTAGLTGLATASFANALESYKELKESQAGLKRSKDSVYDSADDSAVRLEAFTDKSNVLRGNIVSMTALGVGAGLNAAADITSKVAPAGAGFLPGLGTVLGLPTLLGGVAGSIVFNNKKNGDAHGAMLSHELIHGIELDGNGEVSSLMTHKQARESNIEAHQKRNTLNNYRDEAVYKHRSVGEKESRLGKFAASIEHGAMRWGHKAATLMTLGLVPQITSQKDNVRDRVLRHNKGDAIEQARFESLLKLQNVPEAERKVAASNYLNKSPSEKLKTLLDTLEATPNIGDAVNNKFLSRIAKIDEKSGTYKDSENKEHSYLKLKGFFKKRTFKQSDFNKSLNEEKAKELLKEEEETFELTAAKNIGQFFKSSELFKTTRKPSINISEQKAEHLKTLFAAGDLKSMEEQLVQHGVTLSKTGKTIAKGNLEQAGKLVKSPSVYKKALSNTNEGQIITKALNDEAQRFERAAEHLRNDNIEAAKKNIGENNVLFSPKALDGVAGHLRNKNVVQASKLLGKTKLDLLSRNIYDGNYTEAARKIVNNQARSLFAKPDIEGKISTNAFDIARKLSRSNGEKMQEALLNELQIATDHILVFSANKDARREMIVYSQLSDAFEKTKRQKPELYYYKESNSGGRQEIIAEREATVTANNKQNRPTLCADPSCATPHFRRASKKKVAPLPKEEQRPESHPLNMPFCQGIADVLKTPIPEAKPKSLSTFNGFAPVMPADQIFCMPVMQNNISKSTDISSLDLNKPYSSAIKSKKQVKFAGSEITKTDNSYVQPSKAIISKAEELMEAPLDEIMGGSKAFKKSKKLPDETLESYTARVIEEGAKKGYITSEVSNTLKKWTSSVTNKQTSNEFAII